MKRLFTQLACGVLLLVLAPGLVFAQDTGTITGTVTDADDGEPLPGATVQIQELGIGAATDADGQYTLEEVPGGTQEVQVSFVGYLAQTIEVTVTPGETVTRDVSLRPSTAALDELVVTAQQVQRQARSLGYSVSSVSSADVQKIKSDNLIKNLSGKVSGLDITSQSGNVGGGARIILRGIASLGGDNQPLFIIDGTPVSNSNVSSGSRLVGTYDTGNKAGQIDPSSIESISVLKGGAAAALYGQRAKNGVVLITTKSGADVPASASFSTSLTGSRPSVLPDFQNEYGPGSQGKYDVQDLNGWGPRMQGQEVEIFNGERVPLNPADDNVSDFYETGLALNNSVSFSNSGDFGSFRLGASQDVTTGIVPNSELDRYGVNGSFATSALNERLDAQLSMNYITEETVGRVASGGNDPNLLVGIVNGLPRNLSAGVLENNFQNDAGQQISLTEFTNNPYWTANKNTFTTDVERLFGSAQVSFKVTDWLTIQESIGTDIITETRRQRSLKTTRGAAEGEFLDDNILERQIDHDFTVRTNNDFGEDFNLTTIIGHNINIEEFERDRNLAQNLNVDALYNFANANNNTPTNFESQRRIVGVYGDATIGFRDYAFLTLTGRNDWSSTLPKENRSFFYPSISGSVVFTDLLEQEYDLNIPGISYGKLRANYAEVGSDEDPHQLTFDFIPNSDVFGQYGADLTFPFNGLTAFDVTETVPPTDLKPQRQKSWEIGTELGFFDGRVNLDFTYYNQDTEDQIISLPRPESSGFGALRTNVGTVSNNGIEINLRAGLVTTSNFSWRTDVNFAQNTNEVESLAEGVDELILQSGFNGLQVRARPGDEIQIFGVGWERDPTTGLVVINPETGLRQTGEDKALGDLYPDFKMGISNSFSFRNFDLSFLIDWKQGGSVFSSTVQDLRSSGLAAETAANRGGTFIDNGVIVTERDAETGEILETRPNDVPVQSMEAFWGQHSNQSIIESGVFDATYVKLRDVSLTFNFPTSWLARAPVQNAALTLQGRNLLLLYSEIPHIDPETNLFGAGANIGQGVEFNNLPNTTTFGATLNLTF
jgi:TonB-linked SusC/RagA family outer membrane protein